MDRYQRVEKPRNETTISENEIRITTQGKTRNYITYAISVLQDKSSEIVLKAMGRAINKTVTIAEIIKRRVAGLHQITSIGSTDITDTWEPLEEGLEPVETIRHVSMISITLSKNMLDQNAVGYQPPLPADQVKPLNEVEYEGEASPRGRGRGQGRGRGRGRARGTDSEYEAVTGATGGAGGGSAAVGGGGGSGTNYDGGWVRGRGRGRGRGRAGRGQGRGGYDEYYQGGRGRNYYGGGRGYDERYEDTGGRGGGGRGRGGRGRGGYDDGGGDDYYHEGGYEQSGGYRPRGGRRGGGRGYEGSRGSYATDTYDGGYDEAGGGGPGYRGRGRGRGRGRNRGTGGRGGGRRFQE